MCGACRVELARAPSLSLLASRNMLTQDTPSSVSSAQIQGMVIIMQFTLTLGDGEYFLLHNNDVVFFRLLSLLATTSADGTCKIWSTADFNLRNTLKKSSEKWVWDCAFSSDSQYIFTGWLSLSPSLPPSLSFSLSLSLCSLVHFTVHTLSPLCSLQ